MSKTAADKMHEIDEAMIGSIGGIHSGTGLSLNAGNELEGENFVDDAHLTLVVDENNDGVNFDEELKKLTALESRLDDLKYLYDDLKDASGMNQTYALEAQRIIPDFGGVPIGYYSKDLTATRYQISLETLDKNIKETEAEIAEIKTKQQSAQS